MSQWVFRLSLCALLLSLPLSAARFPFDPSRGLVELEGSVNGFFTGRFGIDTGAEGFYLDEKFARAAGLELSEPAADRRVRGLDGGSEIRRATLRSFAVGDERIYNLGVDVVDLSALSHSDAAPPDGLVGQDVLRRFYLTIDYPQRQLDLFSHEPDHTGESLTVVPFDNSQRLIYVDVRIDDAPPLRCILDYCASTTMFDPGALERAGLSVAADSYHRAGPMTVGGVTATGVFYYVRSLAGLNTDGRQIDGVLGYSWLRDFKLTIDYGRGLLLFHN